MELYFIIVKLRGICDGLVLWSEIIIRLVLWIHSSAGLIRLVLAIFQNVFTLRPKHKIHNQELFFIKNVSKHIETLVFEEKKILKFFTCPTENGKLWHNITSINWEIIIASLKWCGIANFRNWLETKVWPNARRPKQEMCK